MNADGSLGRRNDVHTLALEHKLGIHASPTCVLDYDHATGFLIGARHAGLLAMFVMMNITRVGTGVQGLGVSDRAYQQARDYAAERIQGSVVERPEGTPIAEHPDVARLLASMASIVSAMRGLSVQVGEWLDLAPADTQAAQLAEFFVPVLKGWFTETSLQVTSDAVQVHGGAGFIEETGVAQHYRDARILPIYEGTTAIQAKDLVGRKVLPDNGATAEAALSDIIATVEVLRQTDHPVATRTAQRLERAIASLQHSTRTLLQFGEAHRKRDAYAGQRRLPTQLGPARRRLDARACLGRRIDQRRPAHRATHCRSRLLWGPSPQPNRLAHRDHRSRRNRLSASTKGHFVGRGGSGPICSSDRTDFAQQAVDDIV